VGGLVPVYSALKNPGESGDVVHPDYYGIYNGNQAIAGALLDALSDEIGLT
jgi:hypothetical protein